LATVQADNSEALANSARSSNPDNQLVQELLPFATRMKPTPRDSAINQPREFALARRFKADVVGTARRS